MPRPKGDAAFLWDMLDAARAARDFTRGKKYADYIEDQMLRYAVERAVAIIGEAARGVSPEFRDSHPDIPWRDMIAQRNVLVHRYGDIEDERLWLIVTVFAPALIGQIEPLLPPVPEDE